MSLQFCMLESMNGDPVAINVDAVVAVGTDNGKTVVVHHGGKFGVRGDVTEVVLKLIGAAAAQPAPAEPLKAAA